MTAHNKRKPALPADLRPFDSKPIHTDQLPEKPIRDYNVPAEAWVEAPKALLSSAEGIPSLDGKPVRIAYKRRLGRWLLWRAGPAKGDARYIAVDAENLDRVLDFRLYPNGSGAGHGPDGAAYTRFREWKRSLIQK